MRIPIKDAIDNELAHYTSFKMIATSKYGLKYFLCGGFRDSNNTRNSPCYEYINGFFKREDMKNMRICFSLVCLTHYQKLDCSTGFNHSNSSLSDCAL